MNRILNTAVVPDDSLLPVSLSGAEALSDLYRLAVTFKSKSPDIDGRAMLGQHCSLRLETQNRGERFLCGSIIRFQALGQDEDQLWGYEAILSSKFWHATRTEDYNIWQDRTIPEIAEEVLAKHGIRTDWRLKNGYRSYGMRVQYGESDANFVFRILEEAGIYFWFSHAADAETMVLSDNLTVHVPFDAGYATCPYYAAVDGAAIEDVDHFSSITLQHQPEPGEYLHNDIDLYAPSNPLMTRHADPRGHLFDRYSVYRHFGHYTEAQMGHGQLDAQMGLERLQVYQERLVLGGRVRGAAPGHSLTVEGAPRAELNRELLVVSASYDIRDNAYRAQRSATPSHFAVTVEAIPRERQYRPQLRTPIPRTSGPEIATVVGPQGEEIHTDEQGRIRVRMGWHRHSTGDGKDTAYIPVCQPWAGDRFGAVFLPRVGQQVLIDYERGNPDRMICIGRLSSADNMPPWELPSNKTQSGILTRSSPGGSAENANALRFEDKIGAEEVWLHAEKDQRIEVENDESHWVGNDRVKDITRDETTHIGRDRTETVDRHELITIHGNRTEEVDLEETISLHKSRTTEIDDNERLLIHKDRNTRIDWNETLDVGKNRSMQIGQGETLTVAEAKQDQIGTDWSVDVGQNHALNIGQSDTLTVGQNKDDTIEGNWSVSVGGRKSETVRQTAQQSVGLAKMVNVGGPYSLNVGGAMQTIVNRGKGSQIGGSRTASVGADDTTTVTGTTKVEATRIELTASEAIVLNSPTIQITAESEVVLSSGDSTVRLTPALIEILSTLVKIND